MGDAGFFVWDAVGILSGPARDLRDVDVGEKQLLQACDEPPRPSLTRRSGDDIGRDLVFDECDAVA